MTKASGCHLFSGCGYPAPSISDFYFKPVFTVAGIAITKPILLALLTAVIILTFFFVAFRKPKLVPRGAQNLGEMGVLFVRDQILRQQLGKKGDKYLPFIVAIFFFVWVTYITIGIKSKGPIGYFKRMAVPEGAPWWILPLLSPVELFSNILVRPFTLAIRLFANMLAGHLLLLVFGLASWYLFSLSIGLLFAATSFLLTIILTGLEVLIQALQAFIFATLTAFYIADAE